MERSRVEETPKLGSSASRLSSMGEVIPGLWIGSLAALSHLASVYSGDGGSDAKTIRLSVITIVSDERLIQISRDFIADARSTALWIEQIVWRLSDKVGEDFLSPELNCVLDAIDESQGYSDNGGQQANNEPSTDIHACLVRCAKGVSRSTAALAAWLISRKERTLGQAMDTIRRVRPQANPNLGFLAALRAMEQCNGGVDSARLRLSYCSRSDEGLKSV